MEMSFGIIGGDRRQTELARLLAADQHSVAVFGVSGGMPPVKEVLEEAIGADVVILPLPLCKGDGVLNCGEYPMTTRDLFRRLRPEQRIFAGQVLPQQREEAARCGLVLEDYFLREELTVANAAATAEAAVQLAMERMERMLLGMDCLVLGFGRIGKLLSHRLSGMGARVTATARKPEDLAWIRAYGFGAEETANLDGKLGSYGVVFNTVPHPVLGARLVAQLRPGCLCIDLASKQGIDLAAAEALGLSNLWARSLPGRFVPCTAAEAIRDAVYHILSER